MNREAKFMVYVLGAHLQTKERIKTAVDHMPDAVKLLTWYKPLSEFVDSNLVSFPNQVGSDRMLFPAVNIATCNPTFAMVGLVLTVMEENLDLQTLLEHHYFGQLNINTELQLAHKKEEVHRWSQIQSTTHKENEEEFEKKKATGSTFDERIYKTKSSDTYPLIQKNGQPFKFNLDEKYKVEDIVEWVKLWTTKEMLVTRTEHGLLIHAHMNYDVSL
jgi:hypothetical protein